jgi:hypothetical protein
MPVSRKNFSIDPRVRVLFENLESMRKLVNDSASLAEFFTTHKNADLAYAFLSMEKKERAFLGVELDGEMLKREVMQTAVTFSGHHLLSPGLTESAAKDGIKCCSFAGLLKKVNQLIMQSHYQIKGLEERKQGLTGQIRSLKAELKNSEDENVLTAASIEKLHHELKEVDRGLAQTRLETDSPDRHLQLIVDVLSNPEQHISIKRDSLSVNNLGIKTEHAHIIEYAEIDIETSLQRVALIVNIPRDDLL